VNIDYDIDLVVVAADLACHSNVEVVEMVLVFLGIGLDALLVMAISVELMLVC